MRDPLRGPFRLVVVLALIGLLIWTGVSMFALFKVKREVDYICQHTTGCSHATR